MRPTLPCCTRLKGFGKQKQLYAQRASGESSKWRKRRCTAPRDGAEQTAAGAEAVDHRAVPAVLGHGDVERLCVRRLHRLAAEWLDIDESIFGVSQHDLLSARVALHKAAKIVARVSQRLLEPEKARGKGLLVAIRLTLGSDGRGRFRSFCVPRGLSKLFASNGGVQLGRSVVGVL